MNERFCFSGFLAVLVLLTSCMADFDRHRVNFTEGPLAFHFEAEGFELPPGVLVEDPGACRVAELDCLEPPCSLQPQALLWADVDVDHAYSEELLRIDSVSLEELAAVLTAGDLNVRIDQLRILWAPSTTMILDANELALMGPIEPDRMTGSLAPVMNQEGMDGLESHLVDDSRFRVFVELTSSLDPGSPCPEGDLDMELLLRFQLTGEPRL
ncbi:MAG: hypothetical protein JRG91_12685 [Deltaproteobacteria bacterium]|nr:hypothetical protein [Deltaproteobacteria bacterium]